MKIARLEDYAVAVEYIHSFGLKQMKEKGTVLQLVLFTPKGFMTVDWRSSKGNEGTVKGFLHLVKTIDPQQEPSTGEQAEILADHLEG